MSTPRYGKVLAAALCVIRGPQNTVTFVHQRSGPFSGSWLLPGGGVEVGEPVADTARREALEETGIKVADVTLVAVYEIMGSWVGGPTEGYHLLMSCFVADGVHKLDPEFRGDNVDGIAQMPIGQSAPMHSTDFVILTDAGLMTEAEADNRRRLAQDGVAMNRLA